MNEATLERLMMDAALGALNEDVRELLMAHLASHPGRVREAQELRALVDSARQAMSEKCPPHPDLHLARQRLKRERAVAWGARIVAMAACVVIGIMIARVGPQPQKSDVVVQDKPPISASAVAVNDAPPAGELWSASRIYRNAIEANRNEKSSRALPRIFQ